MTLEIVSAIKDGLRKSIIVEFENMDKTLSIHIPTSEYKAWCKENDVSRSDDSNIETFAREYLDGIINTDDTAQLLLKEIGGVLGMGTASLMTFKVDGYWYTLTNGRTGYRLYKEDARQSHPDVIQLYKTVIRSFNKPLNCN